MLYYISTEIAILCPAGASTVTVEADRQVTTQAAATRATMVAEQVAERWVERVAPRALPRRRLEDCRAAPPLYVVPRLLGFRRTRL